MMSSSKEKDEPSMEDSATHRSPPVALTIAGSDSGGGAGIQADLKTFAAHHVFGTSAITAVTAQNTVGVQKIRIMDPSDVTDQVYSVTSDFSIRGTKTGMLATASIVAAVAELAAQGLLPRLVVDPVMVAASGDRLLSPDAIDTYRRDLLPHALLVTPNIPEAEVLSGLTIRTPDDMVEAAKRILTLGVGHVLVKGGHLADTMDSPDIYVSRSEVITFLGARIPDAHSHGTGCTLSSAIVSNLVRGESLLSSIEAAKRYINAAIRGSKEWMLGHGNGPLDHFAQVRHHQ
jgi:hydroxymethylpyrimidine/phosphomethylpyrimidine kinase